MTIALYLMLVSSGLGFETGYGLGSFVDVELARNFELHLEGSAIDQDKIESPGHRFSTLAEIRYGSRFFAALGASYRKTTTEAFDKSSESLLLGAGVRSERFMSIIRYYASDRSENELSGVTVQLEYLRRPYLRATLEFYRFDDTTDSRAALAAGWRW